MTERKTFEDALENVAKEPGFRGKIAESGAAIALDEILAWLEMSADRQWAAALKTAGDSAPA